MLSSSISMENEINTVPSGTLARGFRAGSAELNNSIHMVMSANMIAERTIKTAALSEEIEICGVSAPLRDRSFGFAAIQ
jgi:acyl CoA:acetate/3-ketoacid CoA transferase alpha subunit